MGNAFPGTGGAGATSRYFSSKEAMGILGDETWVRLRKQLEWHAKNGRYVDYALFSRILYRRYERMPKTLCESLFRAFASDVDGSVDVMDFLSSLAVLGSVDRPLTLRFLFRVYDVNGSGELERARVEKVLALAYGERFRLHGPRVRQQLDDVFSCAGATAGLVMQEVGKVLGAAGKAGAGGGGDAGAGEPSRTLQLRDFETYRGPLDVLGAWVMSVLSAFTEPLPPRLLSIERRYSALLEPEEVLGRFHVKKEMCDQLRKQFYGRCAMPTPPPSTAAAAAAVSPAVGKAELSLPAWLQWTAGFVAPELAAALFRAKTGSLKSVWRFVDFAEFCVTFATVNRQARATAVVFAAFHLSRPDDMVAYYASDADDLEAAAATAAATWGVGVAGPADVDLSLLATSSSSAAGAPPPSLATSLDMAVGFGAQEAFFSLLEAGQAWADLLYPSGASTPAPSSSSSSSSSNSGGGSVGSSGTAAPLLHPDHAPSSSSSAASQSLALLHSLRRMLSLLTTSVLLTPAAPSPRSSNKESFSRPPSSSSLGTSSDKGGDDGKEACGANGGLPAELAAALDAVEERYLRMLGGGASAGGGRLRRMDGALLGAAIDLVVAHFELLPGLRDLAVAACCLFGVRPAAPALEKEFITELMLRGQAQCPQTRERPYGPAGAAWCVVHKEWWDAWRRYVGGSAHAAPSHAHASAASTAGAQVVVLSASAPAEPPSIDNWQVLQKGGKGGAARQLLHGSMVGTHVEVVAPGVFAAAQSWYGGGPRIVRHVMAMPGGGTELELFPICLLLVTCDDRGSTVEDGAVVGSRGARREREVLVSRAATVGALLRELVRLHLAPAPHDTNPAATAGHARKRQDAAAAAAAVLADAPVLCGAGTSGPSEGDPSWADVAHLRLWNYASTEWREQRPLQPEGCTLAELQLQEGQRVLVEARLPDGVWPRQRLHALLEAQEGARELAAAAAAGAVDGAVVDAPLVAGRLRLNDGRAGLDNLGNTCYLNASVQALLHTEPLAGYFLAQQHLAHVNVANRLGFGGRLAVSFGRLAHELWTTSRRAVSPKAFCADVGALRPQFSGNDQHDAQELLTFLLEGLGEELCLVQEKPYVEHPDSDGRPDGLLADEWWRNILRRELSVPHAVFSGQFKSVLTCACGYSSARFEHFNILTLPLPAPEGVGPGGGGGGGDAVLLHVTLVLRALPHALVVAVRVRRDADFAAVFAAVRALAVAEADKAAADSRGGSGKTGSVVSTDDGAEVAGPPAPALVGVDARSLFVAAEVHPLRPKVVALYSASKRVAAVHDTDNVVLYQVDHHHVSCGGDDDGSTYGHGHEEGRGDPPAPSSGAGPADAASSSSSSDPSAFLQNAVMGVLQPLAAATAALGQTNTDVPPPPPPLLPPPPPPPPPPGGFGRGGIVDPANLPSTPTASQDPGQGQGAGASSSFFSSSAAHENVRVVLTQRRVRRSDGGGVEMFRPESFGTPVVAVVPADISGAALYQLAQERFGRFLKPLTPAADAAPANGRGHGAADAAGREGSMYSTLRRISQCAAAPAPPAPTAAAVSRASAGAGATELRPLSTEDAMAGALPPRGFCLRLVTGGSLQGDSCSRCPWLARCQGCLVPDSAAPGAAPRLRDGETVAVDWHMVVYEELVDPAAAADVRRHASAVDAEADATAVDGRTGRGAVPLAWCLDKFTEGEALDDSVCARCRSPEGQPPMSQRLALWRTPPVLVVHLKRFHFDRHSRRKLNNKVDFPREGLDLTPYLAPARRQQLRRVGGGEDGDGDGPEAGPADASCLYDLYAVVHHAGVMGGGHYVTTVRDRHAGAAAAAAAAAVVTPASRISSAADLASTAASLSPEDTPSPLSPPSSSTTSPSVIPPPPGGQWWCYNDDSVTAVADPAEVCAASAYVLFYMRRDVWGMDGEEIFSLATGHAAVPVPLPVDGGKKAMGRTGDGVPAGVPATPPKQAVGGGAAAGGRGPSSADKERRSPGGGGAGANGMRRTPPRVGLPRVGSAAAANDDGTCTTA